MNRRAEPRAEGGYTLIEVLLVVVISALILLPLAAWVSLALRQQPVTQDGLIRTANTGLLGAYLPQDIAVAGAAAVDASTDVDMDDCVGGAGEGGRVVLVMISGELPGTKTVYVEAPVDSGGDQGIWRHQCDADAGQPTTSNVVFDGVVAATSRATCSSETDDTPCRQIELTTTPLTGDGDVVLRGTRRTDAESLLVDGTGNRLPVAKIQVVSQTTGSPFTVQLSGADSYDPPDGDVASFQWVLPAGASVTGGGVTSATITVRFPEATDQYVQLTVTDADEASTTTYRRIEASPQSPVAIAAVSPTNGVGGETNFTFTGSGSRDPDGSIASYRWVIGGASAPGGFNHVDGRPNFTMQMPAGAIGTMPVTLTVTDHQGLSDTYVSSIQLGDAPPTTLPGDVTAPVASFVATQVFGTGTWVFDATGSTDDGQIVSYAWDFGLLAGTGGGPTFTKTYSGPGGYLVRLTVTDDTGLSSSVTKEVHAPGVPPAPSPRQVGARMEWPGLAGTASYHVEFEFASAGCGPVDIRQTVGASASPSVTIPPNPCPGGPTRARVGAEANGFINYSGWIQVFPA